MDTGEFYLLISSKRLDTLLCLCHPNSFASTARVNYTHMQPSLIFGTHKFSLQTQEVPSGSGEPQKSALADSLRLPMFSFLKTTKSKSVSSCLLLVFNKRSYFSDPITRWSGMLGLGGFVTG